MRKNHSVAAGLVFFTFPLVSPVFAQQTVVNFTGNIISHTCNVSVTVPTVNLGDVSEDAYGQISGSAIKHQFGLKFTGCPAQSINVAHLKFSGNESTVPGTLGVTGAKGVVIRITDETGQNVPVNTVNAYDLRINGSTQTIGLFEAGLESDGNQLTSGAIAATATIDITYD